MSLNISAEQTTQPPRRRRRKLAQEVVAELSSWNPREFITAFRRWHLGSFSLIHLNVLTLLEAEGPMSMSRLAEALDVSVASTTGIVDRMEKRGLVERRHDLADRRVVLVHPAERGLQVFTEIDKRRRLGLELLLNRLSDEELGGLLAGHRALRAARVAMAKPPETAPPAVARGDDARAKVERTMKLGSPTKVKASTGSASALTQAEAAR